MSSNIETHQIETRVFKPSKDFSKTSLVGSLAEYKKLHAASLKAPAKIWAGQAADLFWRKKWKTVLDWKPPHAKWFVGGKLNVSENCVDRHLGTARENKAALIFEGEPGDVRTLTYKQLHLHV